MLMEFWAQHGALAGFGFILAMFFFPRLTQLFATAHSLVLSVAMGPAMIPVWWAGWVLLPRCLCAVTATMMYGSSNPILVFLTWVWAVTGDLGEKIQGYRMAQKSGMLDNV